MPDPLEIITKVISEHSKITEHVKLTGDTVNDVEALFTLQKAQYKSGWSMTSDTELIKKRDQLLQTINLLGDGLKNHFAYEEKVLPLLFGELLMKATLLEHHEISGQIENANTTLSNFEGLDQDESFSKGLVVLEIIKNLCQTVKDHAHHEEAFLNIMKKAFEENAAYRD
ncbi:hemerythrin domain-containing protein [Chloroflexota bacterium]